MTDIVKWLKAVVLLLAALVVLVGWLNVQLLARPAAAQAPTGPGPLPVMIVNPGFGECPLFRTCAGVDGAPSIGGIGAMRVVIYR